MLQPKRTKFRKAHKGRVHGKAKRVDGRFVVPMYHPAAALHRGDLRSVIEADFALLPGLLSDLPDEPPDEPPPVPAPPAMHATPALAAAREPAATEQARLL